MNLDPKRFRNGFHKEVNRIFGSDVKANWPLANGETGVRIEGLQLWREFTPPQIELLLDALSVYRVVCIPGQDLSDAALKRFEVFANYWGAPVPHPSNFLRGGKPAQQDGDSDGELELRPFSRRLAARVNEYFSGEFECLSHDSPAVLVVSNFQGTRTEEQRTQEPRIGCGGTWHTDIEYERLPLYVSMFLVHRVPQSRNRTTNTWIDANQLDWERNNPYFRNASDSLMRQRSVLPLNGETPFADTAAAFAALPPSDQRSLRSVHVRRKLNEKDEGWLAPIVRPNPRSGIESLHSPIWASRPNVRPAIKVDGMSDQESKKFLDQLEEHILDAEFRYDHPHAVGDVTIWNNYMMVHNSPPMKTNIASLEDARVMYRISCKGDPVFELPRSDPVQWLNENVYPVYKTPFAIETARQVKGW